MEVSSEAVACSEGKSQEGLPSGPIPAAQVSYCSSEDQAKHIQKSMSLIA